MYVCMYVCYNVATLYVYMYFVCMYDIVSMNACMTLYVCMYDIVCMYVCMYACMYVCMHACM